MIRVSLLLIVSLVLACSPVSCVLTAAEPQPGVIPAGYEVRTIATPSNVYFGVAGLDVAANGDVYAGTRYGDVWRLRDGRWTRFADGLHEVAGLRVDRQTNEILVSQKPELTRLIDEDGDGVAETYETVCDQWGFTGNYHEYSFGPVRDGEGNLYGTLNLSHGAGPSVGGSTMTIGAEGRGTCYRMTPDGEYSTFAWGLRSPAGLGIHPDTDELFYTDNQGDWNATSSLHHLVEQGFHGHPGSLRYHPEFAGQDLNAIDPAVYDARRRVPAIWIPHGELANSPGNPAFDTTDGKFGPFSGQIFVGDQTRSNVFRCVLDKVDGAWQGCCVEFINHLQSGVIRLAFAPDGSLWAGQTSRGWGSVGSAPYGVQQIVWDGSTQPFEILHVKLTADGFAVTFTQPLEDDVVLDTSLCRIRHWGYHYHSSYGSEKVQEQVVDDVEFTLSEDRRTLQIRLAELPTSRVYRFRFDRDLQSADGQPLTSRIAWYTLNRRQPE